MDNSEIAEAITRLKGHCESERRRAADALGRCLRSSKLISRALNLIRTATRHEAMKGFAMRHKIPFCLMFMLALATKAGAQDRSTPAATLRSMAAAFGRGDFKQAATCVKGAHLNPSDLKDMAPTIKEAAAGLALSHGKTTIRGDRAVLTGTITMKMSDAQKHTTQVLTRFAKLDGKWLIIADTARLQKGTTSDFVNALAVDLSNPAIYRRQVAEVDERVCLNKIELICVGTQRQTLRNNGVFNVKPGDYMEQVISYTYNKKKELFTCTADTQGNTSYSFNGNLTGLNIANIPLSNQVVMIYEGKDGKLDFRHNGKAAVGFTDAETKLVTPGEAASLHWKP